MSKRISLKGFFFLCDYCLIICDNKTSNMELTKISASITVKDSGVFEGKYDPNNRKFSFNGAHDIQLAADRLQIRNVTEDGALVVAYIYDNDYMPTIFRLENNEPLSIEDTILVKDKEPLHITILIEYQCE